MLADCIEIGVKGTKYKSGKNTATILRLRMCSDGQNIFCVSLFKIIKVQKQKNKNRKNKNGLWLNTVFLSFSSHFSF